MALKHRTTRTSVRTKAIVSRIKAAVSIKSGQVLCAAIGDSNGFCKLAKSSNNNPVIGIAEKNANQGKAISAFQAGVCDVQLTSTATSSDIGKSIYLSNTDGSASLIAPTGEGNNVIHIGYVVAEGNPASVLLDIFHIVYLN